MPFSPDGYVKRANECLRLARSTRDDMLRSELLHLRQTYLGLARSLEREIHDTAPSPTNPAETLVVH